MDSGLGKESFSIISQGKVEAIFLIVKPEDRRGIFEEATGRFKNTNNERKRLNKKLFENRGQLKPCPRYHLRVGRPISSSSRPSRCG